MKKSYEIFCVVERGIAVICMVAILVIVFVAAILRTMDRPLNWAMDMSLFLAAWAILLGADVAYRSDRLVCVDILTNHLPEKARDVLRLVMEVIVLIFLLAMIGYGIVLSRTTGKRTFQGIPGFSYVWVTISIPISCFLMSTTAVRNLIRMIKKIKK